MRNAALKSILVVNLKSLPTWHLDLCRGFVANGVDARPFLVQPQTLAERIEKSLRGLKWSDSPTIQQRLVTTCQQFKPDAIMFLGLMALPQTIVSLLSERLSYTPLLCSWICDCFREAQFSDWQRADKVFYFDSFLESILPRYYPDSSTYTFLPLAADTERYFPRPVEQKNKQLVFVGNVSANRAELLNKIKPQVPLAIHGPNSGRQRFNRRKKLTSAAINALYNAHQVVLNINQSPNTEHGANLRTFEVPAAGSLLLTQASRDLPIHYEPGREVLTYSNAEELVECYQRVSQDTVSANAIADAGLKRTRSAHTFAHRAQSIASALS